MAEFCAECLLKNMPSYKNKVFKLSKEHDLCESCREWKRVVISVNERTVFDDIKDCFKKRKKLR